MIIEIKGWIIILTGIRGLRKVHHGAASGTDRRLYLLEHEIINDTSFLDALENVCNRALIIRNLMVKYMISGEDRIKVNTVSKLDELAQIEKCALEQMLKNIQDCQN